MYTKIGSTIVQLDNDFYYGEIYLQNTKKETFKVSLFAKKFLGNHNLTSYVSINSPDVATEKNIINCGFELVSELTVKRSKKATSFITDDIRYLVSDESPDEPHTYLEILDTYTYPQFRNNGFASKLIRSTINFINDNVSNPVIFTYAGVSIKEYEQEPAESDFSKIISKVANFYAKNGFIDVNSYSDFESGKHMVFLNNITAKPLLTSFINLYSEMKYVGKSELSSYCESQEPEVPQEAKMETSTVSNKKKKFTKLASSIKKCFKPKMRQYDVDYNLGWTMCSVIEAKNFEDAHDKALDMLNNMTKEEQIDNFLNCAEGGFVLESITDIETGKSI